MQQLFMFVRIMVLIALTLSVFFKYPQWIQMEYYMLFQPGANIITLVLPLLYQLCLFGFATTGLAFAAPFKDQPTTADLALCRAFFRSYSTTLWLVSAVLGVVHVCLVSSSLAYAGDSLGYHIAAAVAPFFLTLLIELLLAHPFRAYATLRLETMQARP